MAGSNISFLTVEGIEMQEPLITVIMPSLNVEKYIRECMDSVIGQSLDKLEILCIDAGSTDGTLEVLLAYAEKDCRVRVVHSDVKSYGAQVNLGMGMARGEYTAVVETDDFIDQYMFEKLYHIAEKNDLDFAKADFKGFRTLRNGQRIYDEGRVWRNDDLYGKIVSVDAFPGLYLRDVNIWKGIYRTEFLRKNSLSLNETAGASFQDIGFEHLFLRYAKRGMYIKDMLYYYRRDNEHSSSNKPHGIRFAYQEYKRLLELSLTGGDEKYFESYVYARMMLVFVGEYEKLLSYDVNSISNFRQHIDWLKEILSTKMDELKKMELDIGESAWENIELLINDEEAFCVKWQYEHEKRKDMEQRWINLIKPHKIVILGCGNFGEKCLLFCDRNQIDIVAFSDNNSSLWETEFYGYIVYMPEALKENYKDAKIVISSKKYEESIKRQLIDMGIGNERIVLYSDCLF